MIAVFCRRWLIRIDKEFNMRELTASQIRTVAGGQIQPLADVSTSTVGSVAPAASLHEWVGGGSVTSGAGGTTWSASGGYRLPGGSSIGGHIGGFGGSVTGGGIVWTVAF